MCNQMKPFKVLFLLLLVFMLTACERNLSKDISKFEYEPDSRFAYVSIEHVWDDSSNGVWLEVLVDRTTRVMYLQTSKYQAGYGVGLQVLVDADGKPLLYDGEI